MEQFSIPPGYKLVPSNMKIGSSNSGIIVKMIGSVIFLIVLLVVFMISKVNSEQQLKLRQMELQNEQQASKAQVIMDTTSVEPVSLGVEKKVLSTSPTPAMDLNKNTTTSQDLSPAPASVQVKSQKLNQTPTPAPASASNVSTNGRCGPDFNNTICPGKQCCSYSNWCAGTQGTKSAWCYSSTNKGRDDGKYDGIAN